MLSRLRAAVLIAALPLACPACADSQAAPAPPSVPVLPPPVAAPSPETNDAVAAPAPQETAPGELRIVISAVGDCTLGSDHRSARAPGSFHVEMDALGNDYRVPFSSVLDVLSKDDLTIANLETTLSTATTRIEAPFVFSGKPEYAQILTEGSVEIVNVANNHSYDLGVAGYKETLGALSHHGVGAFGNGIVDTRVIKGVEVVNLGYTGGRSDIRDGVMRAVKKHKRPDNIVIVSFHWGIEGVNYPNDEQKLLGRAAVSAGADLVLGHHPHVLQGIERYKGRQIVYSLGNFVFGGHSNPDDKESIIYQATFTSKDGRMQQSEAQILPVRISSVTDRNDFRPVLLDGADKERVLARIEQYSALLNK